MGIRLSFMQKSMRMEFSAITTNLVTDMRIASRLCRSSGASLRSNREVSKQHTNLVQNLTVMASRTFREFTPETAYDYLLYRLQADLFVESSMVPASMQHILFGSELSYYNIDQIMCIAEDIWITRRTEEIQQRPFRARRIAELEYEWSLLAGEPVVVEFIDKHYFGTASKKGITTLAQTLQKRGPTHVTQNAMYGFANLFQVWYLRIDE